MGMLIETLWKIFRRCDLLKGRKLRSVLCLSKELQYRKVSILIPVYRESELLEKILNHLLNDPYDNKEIYVVIDEPTEKSLDTVRRYKGLVKFILNGKRRGKARALSEALEESNGDILLFLDSDVLVPNNLLKRIVEELKNADIVQLKGRTVKKSFLSRMISYDDIGFNAFYYIFSKWLRRCPGVSGCAFAVKRRVFEELGGFRRVIQEDFDFGVRAFLKNKKFKFLSDLEVLIEPPSSFNKWLKQRRRWSIGTAICIKEYWKDLAKLVFRTPQLILPALFFMFPAIFVLLIDIFVPDLLMEKIVLFSLFLLSMKFNLILPPLSLTAAFLPLFKNVVALIVAFGSSCMLFYAIARKLRLGFNFLEFSIYYFLYSPLWLLITTSSLLKVLANLPYDLDDWVC